MESDKLVILFIPVRKGMMKQMENFYGEVLHFTIDEGEFLVNNIQAIRGQLQYSRVNIDPAKNLIFQCCLPRYRRTSSQIPIEAICEDVARIATSLS